MNKTILTSFASVWLMGALLSAQDRPPLHPLVDRYLREQAGVALDDPNFDPYGESIPARYMQQLTQWEDGAVKAEGDSQFFIDAKQNTLLLVDDVAVLSKNQGELLWMTKTDLRVPLRISSSYTVFGSGNATDVLGVPLHMYRIAEEKREAGRVILWMEPLPEVEQQERDLAYSYVQAEADEQSGDLVKMTFYGFDRKAIKEMELDQYRDFGENFRIPRKTIRDLIFGGEGDYTVIETLEVKMETLPASFFNPNQNSLARFIRRYKLNK